MKFIKDILTSLCIIIILALLCFAAVASICAARATAAYDQQMARKAEVAR